MTYKELREKFPGCGFIKIAGEDTKGGFGRKGQGLYGNCNDMLVTSYTMENDIVHVILVEK